MEHADSSSSLQPSPSSSGSVSSGSPSPSVSSEVAVMLIPKLELYWLLFPQIVKRVAEKVLVGVPEITPVVLFIPSPEGNSGDIDQLVMSPPDVIGVRFTTLTFTIRLSVETS